MPRYKVIVECSGPHGNAALTYRINTASQFAAEFRACQLAGDHYPEYRDIKVSRVEFDRKNPRVEIEIEEMEEK